MKNVSAPRSAAGVAVAVLACAGVLAACSDNKKSDSKSSDTKNADLTEYCDAEVALAAAFDNGPDVADDATPEEQTAAAKEFLANVQPQVDALIGSVPDEIKDETDVLVDAYNRAKESGDTATFEEPAVEEASSAENDFIFEKCDWQKVEVTATDFAFTIDPDKLEAGQTAFRLTNKGDELHEMAIVKINDGVTETPEELLALPEEEAMTKVTEVGGAFAAQGKTDLDHRDLESGDYFMACFIPEGSTTPELAETSTGTPHFSLGMVQSFTVS